MMVAPMSIREANAFVSLHHRHNRPVGSGVVAFGCSQDGTMVGVCILGRPVARALCDGRTIEIRRACTAPTAPKGACSWIYSRARRIASALGYSKVITYTLEAEGGASLRGVGWTPVLASKPHQWQRSEPGKQRIAQDVCGQQKIRWEAVANDRRPPL
jgi:hypothetical protein